MKELSSNNTEESVPKVPAGPIRVNITNPDVTERPERPTTVAVISAGSNFAHTAGNRYHVPAIDPLTGDFYPGVNPV